MVYRWKTPRLFKALVRRVGFRGYFLLTLGIMDIFQGVNFIDPGSPGQEASNRYLAEAIPFRNLEMANWAWAFAWWLVAAFCIYNAFKTSGDHWGFVMGIAIKVAYVTALVYGTTHGMSDGPRRIAIWAWICTAVWVMSRLPEPPWTLLDLDGELERATDNHQAGEGGEDA